MAIKQAFGPTASGNGARRRRSARTPAMGASARWFHLLGALTMILGMFLPLTDVGRALANPGVDGTTPLALAQQEDISTTAFTQVTAIGDFQAQLGCGVGDTFCPTSQLTNHDGLWTTSILLPPGTYSWQIAATTQDGQQYLFDSDGPSTQTDSMTVGDADAGAYFEFDAATQEADATSVPAVVTLATDAGTYAMSPDNGNYSTIVQAPQDGQLSGEVQINNTPSGVPLTIPVQEGPNRVTVDPFGSLLDAQSLGFATLTIDRIDGATEQPIAGGCYEVVQNGQVISRGCDTDDGMADGSVTLSFPTGFTAGTVTVREASAPDGVETAPDQDVDMQLGDNSVEIRTGEPAGEPTAEPTDEGDIGLLPTATTGGEEPTATTEETQEALPGAIFVSLVDQNQAPIGGASFQLLQNGNVIAETSDATDAFPNNGTVGFTNIPAGTYTLHQSSAPEGTEPAPDQDVTVPAGGEENITVTAPAPAEPTPAPTGDIVVLRQDDLGAPVGGACFQLIGQDGNPVGEPVCDEDGDFPDDGRIGFFDIPAGSYTLRETRTPQDYEQAADTPVDVQAGTTVEVAIGSAAIVVELPTAATEPTPEPTATEEPTATTESPTEEPTATTEATEEAIPGSLIVTLHDQDDQPVGGACFELRQGETILGPICDSDDPFPGNGNTGFFNQPSGTYTLHQTTVPDGTQPVPDQEVQIPAGQEQTVVVQTSLEPTAEATETPTEEGRGVPGTGSVVIDLTGIDQSQGAVCVELNTAGGIGFLDAPGACDNGEGDADPAPGVIRLDNVAPGSYSLFVIQGPAELVNAAPQQVTVEDGGTAQLALAIATPEPTATETPEPTATETPEPTATETPAPTATPEPGAITVVFQTVDNVPVTADGACITIDGIVTGQCDNLEGDADGTAGAVSVGNLAPGSYTGSITQAPTGYTLIDTTFTADVAAAQTSTVVINVELATTSFSVVTTDVNNTALPNACYALDGGEAVCDDDADGTVVFSGVVPGDHTVTQVTAPGGYGFAAEQVVTVAGDGSTVAVFQNIALTGAVVTQIFDESNAPLGGVCVTIEGVGDRCDGGTEDRDPAQGVIRTEGVTQGDHQVSVITVPEGYDVPDDVEVASVVVDINALVEPVANVSFTIPTAAPTTGGLDVTVQFNDNDEPIGGVCVIATRSADSAVFGPICDGGEGDTNGAPGIVGFADDLATGTYLVSLQDGTTIDGGDVAGTIPVSVDVVAGGRSAATLEVPRLPTTGSLRIVTTDSAVNLPGATFHVTGAGVDITVTDGDGTDVDGTAGVIQLDGLAAGAYVVEMTTAPGGYNTAANQEATITAGETATVEFTVTLLPNPGSLTVRTVNAANENLTDACYAVEQGATRLLTVCDGDDGANDGTVTFAELDAGTYRLVQTRTPAARFTTAPAQDVTINAGENTDVVVTLQERPGRLVVITVDEADRAVRLDNACYQLQGATTFGPFCDADDGNVDGRVIFTNVPAGDYTLIENVAPTGFNPAADRNVTIGAGGSLQITVANARIPLPEATGQLVVIPLDPNGSEVAGGCYQVFDGDRAITDRVCDNADDQPRRIIFNDLPVGDYTVVERLAPSPDYVIADPMTVTIEQDTTTELRVEHQLRPGRLLIQAVNSTGLPLSGACFNVSDDGQDALCTNASGEILITDLAPGTRTMAQTQAPYGYKLDTASREIVIRPGQTTVIRLTFEVQPPPNTGTVQVQKFVCPAGDEGERTMFLGGAQGNAQLKQTAGCTPAVAAFDLAPENGSAANERTFSTTTEGRYQVTVEQGIYVLTETNPDLAGNSSARLRVGVGQMTTVIVINFVEPPQPEPATINVQAYTCPPSFNGTTYGDFANSCASDTARTNQITVRAEGESRFKQVTGDQGQLGTTRFAEVPAGTYNIFAEKPFNVPLMYMFCGGNADNPTDYKVINGVVRTDLANGETITCKIYLIPEQFSADTGALLVQKYSCPIDTPVKGFKFQEECSRSAEQIVFEIAVFNAEQQAFEPLTQVTANPDGIVRFPNLRPGTYKLTEVGSQWCFAQSNSVNADGNVVIQANKLAEVWVYNCVGTQEPPNTGSGDAAGLLNGPRVATPVVAQPDARTPD